MNMNYRGFGQGDAGEAQPFGRLVMIVEQQLSAASRGRLKDLLSDMRWRDEVTMISGMTKACVMQVGRIGDGLIYNRDYITPEDAFGLMPWKEIWLVASGRVWQLNGALD